MHTTRRMTIAATWTLALVLACGTAFAAKRAAYRPTIDPAKYQSTVDNPYFPLVPGTTLRYVEKQGKRTSENDVTVTSDTKVVLGVTCVVVHDIVKENGVVTEDTYDWYAQDVTGTVWYFGEDTKEFHGGRVDTEGSWQAGVHAAQPGVIMWGDPRPGKPYRQEYLAGEAEDMGQVMALGDSVTVPYGGVGGCLLTKEWSLLEAGTERKWYAKGIGLVRAESTDKEIASLVSVSRA